MILPRAPAHVRTDDKENTSRISVITYDLMDYPALVDNLTLARLEVRFVNLSVRAVRRFEPPQSGELSIILEGALRERVIRGTVYRLTMDVVATSNLMPWGHQLRLHVSSSCFPEW